MVNPLLEDCYTETLSEALAADEASVVSAEKPSDVSSSKTFVADAQKTPDISIKSTTPRWCAEGVVDELIRKQTFIKSRPWLGLFGGGLKRDPNVVDLTAAELDTARMNFTTDLMQRIDAAENAAEANGEVKYKYPRKKLKLIKGEVFVVEQNGHRK